MQFKTEEKAKQEQEAIDLDVSTKPEVPHQDEADADASDSSGDGADAPDVKDVKDSFRRLAARLVSQKVDLVIDPKDESQLAQALKGTCAVREVPEGPEKYRAIIYDSKTSGEAATCPWRRLPPMKQKLLERYIQGALKALAGPEYEADPEKLAIGPQDIFFFFDAMKHQQEKVWKDCFVNNAQKLEKHQKLFYVTYDEASLRKKGKSARGSVHEDTDLDCVEYLHCATSGLSISPDTYLLNWLSIYC